jgi:hypothetical protein
MRQKATYKPKGLQSAIGQSKLSPEEFMARYNAGQKKCSFCKEWKDRETEFTSNRSRWDKKNPLCRHCIGLRDKRRSLVLEFRSRIW